MSDEVRTDDCHHQSWNAEGAESATTDGHGARLLVRPAVVRQLRRLLWFGAAALAVYELTAEPVSGVVVFWAKFGFDDLCAAFWLLWQDPARIRGLAHFCLYLAFAALKIGIAAFVLLVLLAAVFAHHKNVPAAAPPVILLAFFSMFVVAAVGTTGVLVARLSGYRVWLAERGTFLRFRGWPPACDGSNAVSVLTTALAILWIVLCVVVVICTLPLFPWPQNAVPPACGACVLVACLVLLPFIGLTFAERTARRIAARSPREAWGRENP